MHFHPRWSGPIGGFGHIGYHIGEGRYEGVGQQRTRQEIRTVQKAKPHHRVSPKTTKTLEQAHKQSMQRSKDAQSLGGSEDQEGPKSETLADDEANPDVEKGPKKVAAKQNKAQSKGIEIKDEAVASS
jgi:hypothetical protein